MKIIKVQFFIAFLTTLFVSCANNKEESIKYKPEVVKELPVKLAHVEVNIEGMTCEIGCARLIQSKLYKVEGISYDNISFEQKKGKVTYDANQINELDIKGLIESIAGGELYKVSQIEAVAEFKEDESKATF